MILKDLCCPQCDAVMIQTSGEFICCPNGHGRLRTAPKRYPSIYKRALKLKEFQDAPSASHVAFGWYRVAGMDGRFRIVLTSAGQKLDPMDCPEGCFVAIYNDEPHIFREEAK